MAQIEVFLNSIRLVNNIFYLLFIGAMVLYGIMGHLDKKSKKILRYVSIILSVVFLMGVLLTIRFIIPSLGQILNIIDIALVPLFIFYFVKLLIEFPQIKYRKTMRVLMIFVVVSTILLVFVRILFGEILYSYMQFFTFIADFWIVYLFVIMTLISIENKDKVI